MFEEDGDEGRQKKRTGQADSQMLMARSVVSQNVRIESFASNSSVLAASDADQLERMLQSLYSSKNKLMSSLSSVDAKIEQVKTKLASIFRSPTIDAKRNNNMNQSHDLGQLPPVHFIDSTSNAHFRYDNSPSDLNRDDRLATNSKPHSSPPIEFLPPNSEVVFVKPNMLAASFKPVFLKADKSTQTDSAPSEYRAPSKKLDFSIKPTEIASPISKEKTKHSPVVSTHVGFDKNIKQSIVMPKPRPKHYHLLRTSTNKNVIPLREPENPKHLLRLKTTVSKIQPPTVSPFNDSIQSLRTDHKSPQPIKWQIGERTNRRSTTTSPEKSTVSPARSNSRSEKRNSQVPHPGLFRFIRRSNNAIVISS